MIYLEVYYSDYIVARERNISIKVLKMVLKTELEMGLEMVLKMALKIVLEMVLKKWH